MFRVYKESVHEEASSLSLRIEAAKGLHALQGLSGWPRRTGDAMTWEKKPVVETPGFVNNCLEGGPQRVTLPLDTEISIGFGSCWVMKDDNCVYSETPWADEDAPKLQKFEDQAKADPDHDWQVHFRGAMSKETYQRHGDGSWVLIEKGVGFA